MCRVGGWTRSEGEINMARLAGSISLAGASSGGPLTSVSSLMTVGRCLLNNVVFAGDAPRDHTHINTTADRSRERGQLTDMLVRRPKLGKNGRILSRVVRRLGPVVSARFRRKPGHRQNLTISEALKPDVTEAYRTFRGRSRTIPRYSGHAGRLPIYPCPAVGCGRTDGR